MDLGNRPAFTFGKLTILWETSEFAVDGPWGEPFLGPDLLPHYRHLPADPSNWATLCGSLSSGSTPPSGFNLCTRRR